MFARVIADRYARAVLQSCPDLDTIERADSELNVLRKTWDMSEETREFLLNPKIPPAIKISILGSALGDKLSPIVLNLLVMLIEKRRQGILPDIADRYSELTDTVRGVEHAEIVVARPIPPDLQKQLLDAVQRFSARDVEVSIKVNPSILGGVQVRMGDRVIDGSLKSRFEAMRQAMLKARLPRLSMKTGSQESG